MKSIEEKKCEKKEINERNIIRKMRRKRNEARAQGWG